MRSDFIGCAGNDVVQTPTINYLAKRGIRFDNAFSPQPVCIPARASIMTGMEGHTLGLTEYIEGFELPTKQTLPQQLKDNGYQTKVVGKMHVYPERCHYGFESMLLCEEGRKLGKGRSNQKYDDYEMWLAEQGYAGQAFSHGMGNNSYTVTTWPLPDYLHPTEWIGMESCKAIINRDWTRPLFLWCSFTAPHPPLAPLNKDFGLYDESEMHAPVLGDWLDEHPAFHQYNLAAWSGDEKTRKEIALAHKAYCALITQVDRQINRIIGTLREEGMLENTWFIFTSDHGDNLGDHQLWGKRSFLKGSCQIPFIITPPTQGDLSPHMGSEWVPGEVSSAVVGLQDILPTCLEIAGVEQLGNIDGKSLLSTVKNPQHTVRETILGEIGMAGGRSLMVTDGKWKYIWYEQDGKELLFHIEEDPGERHNLAHTLVEELKKWREKLVDYLTNRKEDRAVLNGDLQPFAPGITVSEKEKAFLVTNHNVRGLHL